MNNLEVLAKMSKDGNNKLKMSPLSNIISAQSGKDGWGKLTIAIPNVMIPHFILQDDFYVGGLILAEREEFNNIKEDSNV